jgi:eukaryotic-like serine/threonine-protein kinase
MTVPGETFGSYRVLGKLGEGGMGEVYRATDSRLKRQVAIKILPASLAADPDRLARFQREAEVLASLNHPHIAAVYGLEDTAAAGSGIASAKALVMELVEGPTLADRIAQGPIPIDEALPIARQIADALEAAHAQGIIHRDLKPANIKVREDGTVKVLDFGLAKLTEAGGAVRTGSDHPSQSPTLTSPAMTAIGMILGTAAYMSPEQARGRAVDKRTDVWAFGAVLYEMLTAKRAFDGEDVTEMMASVVKSTPDWSALPAETPPQVVTLIQRCLEKDRQARIADMAVAKFLLAGHVSSGVPSNVVVAPPAGAGARSWRQALPWVIGAAVLSLLVGASIGWLMPRRATEVPLVTRLQMNVFPADQLVGSIASVRPARTAIALSPDGRTVAFVATSGNVTQLYIRGLDRAEASPVHGTEGASEPFFSPDGAWIGFRAGNKIRKVLAAGGAPVTIAEVDGGTPSWGDNGAVFFAGANGISSVPSNGGAVATVTTRDAARRERHILPQPLPGSRAIIFTIGTTGWDTANVVLRVLDSGEQRVLVQGGADARYVGTGHIAYMKSGTLMAVPFDVRSLQVTGTPVVLIEGVMQAVNAPNSSDETGAGQFAVSSSGTLIYATGGTSRLLEGSWMWVDRTGAAQPVEAVPAGPYLFPRLSPDGQTVAVTVRAGSPDVWVYDVVRGAPTRLTFEGGSHPIWSPDGKRLAFTVMIDGVSNLHVIDAGGGGKPERLAQSPFAQIPTSWTATPNVLVFLQRPQLDSYGIWVLPMDGENRTARIFVESKFPLSHAELSPDGRWLAYVSRESGAPEVYVQPFPGSGQKTRISTSGGTEPIWLPNGREILYRHAGQFFSATIRSVSPFQIDPPRLLFATKGEYDSTSPIRSWNVSPNGQRFLLSRFAESKDKPVTAIHVVLNWAEELKRLVPAK